MSDSDQMRADFEAFAKANDLPTAVLHSGKNSGYVDPRTAWAFEGYRAGRKAEREELCIQWEGADETIAEVERLRTELAQLRKDWCDDDEQVKQQALRVLDAAKVEGDSVYVPRMGSLAEMMADEVERLRIWNKRWRDVSAKLRLTVAQLYEELAAAKAASVVPVRVLNIYDTEYPSDCYIECRTGDDCMKFRDWLFDRMKDKTPPAA